MRGSTRREPAFDEEACPARRYFQGHTHEAALREAEGVLAEARPCRCCRSAVAHLFDRIGSTLFLDDDPVELAGRFDPDERDAFTPRVLAACILLRGRPRGAPWGPTPVPLSRAGRRPSPRTAPA
jgi:hypothetical protein